MSLSNAGNGRLSAQDVRNIAQIAQIELTDGEAESFAEDLSATLESVSIVSKIGLSEDPNEAIAETSRPIALTHVTRPDVVADQLTLEQALQNAPDQQDGMFRVGSILGEAQ